MNIVDNGCFGVSLIPDYKEKSYSFTESIYIHKKYLFGNFLADFANLDTEYIHAYIQEPVKKIFLLCSTDPTYPTILQNEVCKHLDTIRSLYSSEYPISYVGEILATDIIDRLEMVNYSPANMQDLLFPNIIYLEELKQLCIKLINRNYNSIDRWDYALISDTQIQIYVNNPLNPKSYCSYKIKKLNDIIAFDNMNYQKYGTPIKICQNCGKYFVPLSRSDEIYCNNIFQNGNTCKQVGYENKLKADIFKSAYRRAYKTQHARIKYNSHVSNYEKIHFIPWTIAAKEAMKNFSEVADIEGFEEWLKNNKDTF